jgi:hypothetical protein
MAAPSSLVAAFWSMLYGVASGPMWGAASLLRTRQWPAVRHHRRDAPRRFVITGNTRVGGTWLAAALNGVPDVSCAKELRWLMPYQARVGVHSYLDPTNLSTTTVAAMIDAANDIGAHTRLLGTKLKFDPYGYVAPREFARIGVALPADTAAIFLRRDYFEIFLSWKVYGIRHRANPDFFNAAPASRLRGLEEFFEMHAAPVTAKPITFVAGPSCWEENGTTNYSIDMAIHDLLVLFYNDLMIFEHIADRGLCLRYDDIAGNADSIAQWLSIDAPALSASLALSPLAKLEDGDFPRQWSCQPLEDVSRLLMDTFDRVARGRLAVSGVVSARSDRIVFTVAGLAQLISRCTGSRPKPELWLRPLQVTGARPIFAPKTP